MRGAKSAFIRGTFILSASSLITRSIGFVGGIMMARYLGAEGMGLMRMAHPLLPLVLTLTQLGLPVAISKYVSEAEARGDSAKVKRIMTVSLTVTGTLSVLFTLLSFVFAKAIAAFFLPDPRAYAAMLAITPIAPVIAISAILKGYFRGKQDMKPIAVADVIEHAVHLAAVLVVVKLLLPYGVVYAAAGALACSIAGEGAGLAYVFFRYRWQLRGSERKQPAGAIGLTEGKRTLAELLHMGLPTTGNGFFGSIYHAFLPKLVIHSLALFGLGTAAATKQFGLLTGFVFPLLFFPSFVTHSLSTALIPAISEANANKDGRLMHRRMDQAVRIALGVGVPCTVILFMWAVPLTTLIYHSPEAGELLKWLAPIFFFHYFESPLYSILLGLGKATTAMWNAMIGTVVEGAAIYLLGSMAGVQGIALAVGFGVFLMCMLNMLSVSGSIGIYLDIRHIVRAGFSAGVMALCGRAALHVLQQSHVPQVWALSAAIMLSIGVYLAAHRLTGLIGPYRIRPAVVSGR